MLEKRGAIGGLAGATVERRWELCRPGQGRLDAVAMRLWRASQFAGGQPPGSGVESRLKGVRQEADVRYAAITVAEHMRAECAFVLSP